MSGHGDPNQDGLRVDHHFENSDQQYQSAKLGMWLFLATEILFFGGLFVAYSVYRANNPEIFVFGHHFLDTNLGALNTVILICSSLTAAWAVRAAQLRQIPILKLMIALTVVCAFGFMGIKAVEYNSKGKHGLLWAGQFDPHFDHGEHDDPAATEEHIATGVMESDEEPVPEAGESVVADPDLSTIAQAPDGPAGLAPPPSQAQDEEELVATPANAQIYFSIYFLLTGLIPLMPVVPEPLIRFIRSVSALSFILCARATLPGQCFSKISYRTVRPACSIVMPISSAIFLTSS